MKNFKTIGIMGFAVALAALFAISAQADQWNKKTILTINETLQIPGATLTPGKYVFKLADSQSNRHIVQVFNEDETKVIATILAIPNQRLRPTGKSEFGFWEMPQGSPTALRSWFYPGDNFGQEFAYPRSQATTIAAAVKEQVPSISDQEQAQLSRTPEPAPKEEPKEIASAQQPRVETPRSEQPRVETPTTPTQPPRRDTTPAEPTTRALPRTASAFPFVGLIGFLSLGLALMIRVLRQYIS